jgi:hypothetical protein
MAILIMIAATEDDMDEHVAPSVLSGGKQPRLINKNRDVHLSETYVLY